MVAGLIALIAVVAASAGIDRVQATKLSVWEPPTLTAPEKAMQAAFTKKTGIQLDITVYPTEAAMLAKWATGERPDLLYWHPIGNWLSLINPTKNLVDLSHEGFVKRQVPGLLAHTTTWAGKVYGPVYVYPSVFGAIYNQKIFKQYNLPLPKTFDDIVSICQKLQAANAPVTPIFEAGGDQWPLQILPLSMWASGLAASPNLIPKINHNKAAFTNPIFTQGVADEQTLKKLGCYNSDVATATFADSNAAIMGGKAAMIFEASGLAPYLAQNYGGNAAVNNILRFTGVSQNSAIASWQAPSTGAVFVPKTGNSTRTKAALTYIRYITGTGYALYLRQSHDYPTFKGYKTPKGQLQVLADGYWWYRHHSYPTFSQDLLADYGNFPQFLQAMITGQSTPEQVTQNLQQSFAQSAKLAHLSGF